MDEEEEWPETWDRNKVYMYTDPDGNKVPVPYGFTVSGAESEKYVNHNVEMRGTWEDLIWTPGEKTWTHDESDTDKAWKLNEDNVWVSQNNHAVSSNAKLNSNEFIIGENGGKIKFELSVSSSTNNDWLKIELKNLETNQTQVLGRIWGTELGTTYNNLKYLTFEKELSKGNYIVTASYTRGIYSYYSGLDCGFIKKGQIIDFNNNEGNNISTVHKCGGLVIYEGEGQINDENSWEESINRNQFVWVPVPDINRVREVKTNTHKIGGNLWKFSLLGRSNYYYNPSWGDKRLNAEPQLFKPNNISIHSKYNLQGYTNDMLYKELRINFDKTMESIEKYGGFYIGRYETGNLTSNIPVVKRINSDLGNITYYDMYTKIKDINQNPNIHIDMIWGSLWDETLQWLIDTGDKSIIDIKDSSEWGNHYNSTFAYTTINGEVKEKSSINGWTIKVPTGSTERNKANNIYDLAGNVSELTLENNGQSAIPERGGYAGLHIPWNGNGSVDFRYNVQAFSTKSSDIGTRVYFYIK